MVDASAACRPFSQACENNKHPILAVLRRHLVQPALVLEIGSGTGQHAAFFSSELPHLTWQPTDVVEHLPGIAAWRSHGGGPGLRAPLPLDVRDRPWPEPVVDAVFSANTAHIMSWEEVTMFFDGVAEVLPPGGILLLYGPFHYGGAATSPSNAEFDRWLRRRDPKSGVRHFEAIDALAGEVGLRLREDHSMPAHNRLLVWQRD